MTQITINEIQITGSQIIVKINNSDNYFELFDLAQLLQEIQEKTIVIKSRTFSQHNDKESFKNHFMMQIWNLLDNANFKQFPEKYVYKRPGSTIEKQNYKLNYPHWLIDKIDYRKDQILVTIRNIKNEKLEDEY